jgi:hypothetical protein
MSARPYQSMPISSADSSAPGEVGMMPSQSGRANMARHIMQRIPKHRLLCDKVRETT